MNRVGFVISDPRNLDDAAWRYIDENFEEACPSPNYWTFYAKHEEAKQFMTDLKAQGNRITLI